ncbi:unnamed protein product, partial [Polarella glacialis]
VASRCRRRWACILLAGVPVLLGSLANRGSPSLVFCGHSFRGARQSALGRSAQEDDEDPADPFGNVEGSQREAIELARKSLARMFETSASEDGDARRQDFPVSPLPGELWAVEESEFDSRGLPRVGTVLLAHPAAYIPESVATELEAAEGAEGSGATLEGVPFPNAALRTGLRPMPPDSPRTERARLPVVLITKRDSAGTEGLVLGTWSGQLLGDLDMMEFVTRPLYIGHQEQPDNPPLVMQHVDLQVYHCDRHTQFHAKMQVPATSAASGAAHADGILGAILGIARGTSHPEDLQQRSNACRHPGACRHPEGLQQHLRSELLSRHRLRQGVQPHWSLRVSQAFVGSSWPRWAPQRTRGRLSAAGSQNPFDVLGVSRSSDQDEIRASFRQLVRTYHPDVPSTGNQARFLQIKDALDQLSSPEGRAKWAMQYHSYSSYYDAPQEEEEEEEVVDWFSRRRAEQEEAMAEADRRSEEKNKKMREKQQEQARGSDRIWERELDEAMSAAHRRKVARKRVWTQSFHESRYAAKHFVDKEISKWKSRTSQAREDERLKIRAEEAKWKEELEMSKEVDIRVREEDARDWVDRFAVAEAEASRRREEIGRIWSDKIRVVKEATRNQTAEEAAVQAEAQEELHAEVLEQVELQSQIWMEGIRQSLQQLRRSRSDEPSAWKDKFRNVLDLRILSKSRFSDRALRGRKFDEKALQWKEYNRRRWLKKFRDAEDKAIASEQAEERKWVDLYWRALQTDLAAADTQGHLTSKDWDAALEFQLEAVKL